MFSCLGWCCNRAPVALSSLAAEHVLFRPGVMVQALLANYTAEALLNAPRVLGSLQLLLNPTGLLTSVSAGLVDLFGLPAAALMAGSPSQVCMHSLIPQILNVPPL